MTGPSTTSERMLVQAAFELRRGGQELEGRKNVLLVDPIWSLEDWNFDQTETFVCISIGSVAGAIASWSDRAATCRRWLDNSVRGAKLAS